MGLFSDAHFAASYSLHTIRTVKQLYYYHKKQPICMVVGICQLKLIIHDTLSLKEKRRRLRKIIARVKNTFPVSIAEVGDYDQWQSSLVGFCLIGNERGFINSSLDKVINFIENLYIADVVDTHIEIISL